MIRKFIRLLRWEAESAKKARMEGKVSARGGRRKEQTRQRYVPFVNNNTHFHQNKMYNQRGRRKQYNQYQPYTQEAYEAYTPKGSKREDNNDKSREYV